MTFLSRIVLTTRDRQVQRGLGDCQQLHRLVLSGFPQDAEPGRARAQFGVLYRVEPHGHDPSLVRLVVQSTSAPDWRSLPVRALGPDPDGRGNPAVRPLDVEYGRITAGTKLIFRLRANPTKRLSDRTLGREDRLAGKRVALLREDEQIGWLARQGERHGFRLLDTALAPEIPAVRAATHGVSRGWRGEHDAAPAMPLTFGAVLFEGRLEVTDGATFLTALRGGIGSGKAYGFGLLSIASER